MAEEESDIDLRKVWKTLKSKLGLQEKPSARTKKTAKKKSAKESDEVEIDFSNIIKAIANNKKLITYLLLITVIIVGGWVRTLSIPNYNRVLLGLDPFAFYRYANQLVTQGYLSQDDPLRYFPEGFKTFREHQVITYFVAGMYTAFHYLIPGSELIDFSIIYPVIAFIISALFFFLMCKELFDNKTALIATAFLAFAPSYLFRTVAGFADKEAMAMLFWFSMIYALVKAYKAKKVNKALIYGSVSGVLAGMSSLTWGGANFLFQSIAGTAIIITLIGRLNNKRMIIYLLWSIPLLIMSATLTVRYGSLIDMFSNQLFIGVFASIAVIGLYKAIYEPFLKKKRIKGLPEPVWLLMCFALISLPLIIGLQASGLYNIVGLVGSIWETLLHPLGTCPFCVSVSENQPPYFIDPYRSVDWWSRLQWLIPLFILGSTLYMYKLVKKFGKTSRTLVVVYCVFLFSFMFSRFSSEQKYDGFNNFMGAIFIYTLPLLAVASALFYLKHYKNKQWDGLRFEKLFIILWFIISIVAARGAIRIIFALTPIASLLAAYGITKTHEIVGKKFNDKVYSYSIYALAIIVIFLNFQLTYQQAGNYWPSFTPDWGVAMDWVKTNTPQDAVFTHWWDYGYWVQTMGERATTLDGGNYRVDWDEVVGGKLFSAYNLTEALESLNFFSKAMPDGSIKRPDYFLVMDDDVLKYVQMANIGGKPSHYSVFMFAQQISNTIYEPDNYSTMLVFQPATGIGLTGEDLIIDNIIFSKDSTFVVNILIPMENQTFGPALAYLVNTELNKQAVMPYNCACEEGIGCYDVLSAGTNACTYFVEGAIINIPADTKDRLMTRLYLLNMTIPGFELVYDSPANLTVNTIISQGDPTDIRIYKINYPELEAAAALEVGNP